jgi:hypothetical protein
MTLGRQFIRRGPAMTMIRRSTPSVTAIWLVVGRVSGA